MEMEAEVSLNPLRISLFYGNMLTLVQARTKFFLFEFLQRGTEWETCLTKKFVCFRSEGVSRKLREKLRRPMEKG